MHGLARRSVMMALTAGLTAGSLRAAEPVGPFFDAGPVVEAEVLGPPVPTQEELARFDSMNPAADRAARVGAPPAVARSSGVRTGSHGLRSDATISLSVVRARGVGGSRGPSDDASGAEAQGDAVSEPPPPTGLAAWFKGWDGKVELGLNGTSGNSDAASLRFRVSGHRAEGRNETKASLTYRTATTSGVTTQNRLDIEGRHDWKSKDDGRWRVFGNARSEWDEFQDYDLRLSGFLGLGYDLIRSDDLSLIGRAGLGGSMDMGGLDDGFHPEGIVSLDSSYTISERQRLTARAEALPNFESSDYRVETEAAWEMVIDPDSNLSLRIGGEVRYDSATSPGYQSTDSSYFMTLGWSF